MFFDIQQQLIACIMMLLSNPDLILLDEPTAALSPHAIVLMTRLLLEYHVKNNCTMLCVTHDMEFSEALATLTHELQDKGALVVRGNCI